MKKRVYSSILSKPYVPNRQNMKRDGRTSPYSFIHRIAYTEAWRGDNYDERVLLFQAPFALVKDVCQFIFNVMDGKIGNLIISNEHSCRHRNGKCYWRVMVQVVRLDEQFISFKEFVFLMIARMKRICNCTVRHYRLETFVNL